MLTEKEITRYSRHLLLSEIGKQGQEKLKNSRVLVIGAGGLGCPVLMYLTAAGVGKIGVIDFDKVDESNLQRQVLFDVNDIGKPKSEVAKEKLSRQNPLIKIESVNDKLTVKNALDIFFNYDIIMDGTDNFSTRYLVNDACVLLDKILVSGSIFKFQGQISVFNHKDETGKYGPTYRCLFPSPPSAGSVPSCSEIGVMGVLSGIIGTLMANETIKIITHIGKILSGKVLLFDALALNFHTIEIKRNPVAISLMPSVAEFKKADYDFFCGIEKNHTAINEISAMELFAIISARADIRILDVREPDELPLVSEFHDLMIPLGKIEQHIERIPHDKKVIVICRNGNRSRRAIELLSEKYGFSNLYNLKGGVLEWIITVSEKQKV